MQVSPINNNNNPNFGHSFRVSICLKGQNGQKDTFINPYSDAKLYKTLNSKIVGWLNEDYLENLRRIFGIRRKVQKREPYGDIHKKMAEELRSIDSDYKLFSNVRSVYRRNQIGYILTGIDVPIAENLKGLKYIGTAKADARLLYKNTHTDYIKDLVKAVRGNILGYVQNENVLLRSSNNKEIMLKTVFKQTGVNKSGNPIYELDSYEFHENKTKPTLPPISAEFQYYKYRPEMRNEIQRTVENQLNRILGRRVHFNSIDTVLNITPKKAVVEVKPEEKPVQKAVAKDVKPKKTQVQKEVTPEVKPTQKTATTTQKIDESEQKQKGPIQLELNFEE